VPTIKNGNATIYYEEHGNGFAILAFSPGGLPRSTIKIWSEPSVPINPITELSKDYRVIVMDQRNTVGGQSRACQPESVTGRSGALLPVVQYRVPLIPGDPSEQRVPALLPGFQVLHGRGDI
jgi:hypothetical protein